MYLFELENPHLHVKDKNIRKYAYDVLLVLCRNNKNIKIEVMKKILEINIKERDPDENYIEFRK